MSDLFVLPSGLARLLVSSPTYNLYSCSFTDSRPGPLSSIARLKRVFSLSLCHDSRFFFSDSPLDERSARS